MKEEYVVGAFTCGLFFVFIDQGVYSGKKNLVALDNLVDADINHGSSHDGLFCSLKSALLTLGK